MSGDGVGDVLVSGGLAGPTPLVSVVAERDDVGELAGVGIAAGLVDACCV
jgi:hypothetical protein